MARDTKELDGLLAALNRSGERMQTLWFSFLALSLYLVITALTTTHRMLMLEEAQQLPIVNLKVPLLPFYVLAPLLFLVVHFYVLLMLLLLARSASVFDEELRKSIFNEGKRETYRMRVENTPFLQLLVGPKPERSGANRLFVSSMALITVVVAPVLTLVVMQMQFLPYHHPAVTWAHRALVLIDVALVFLLWRGYRWRQGRAVPSGFPGIWRRRRPGWAWRGAPTALGVLAALWLTLWEGRWAGEPWIDPIKTRIADIDFRLVVAGVRLFEDRMRLPNETLVGETLLEEKKRESVVGGGQRKVFARDFRGRNFAYADFSTTDLRGVDLRDAPATNTPAILTGADLRGALLQGADLSNARLAGADIRLTKLQGANLSSAKLQGAHLSWAELQGADLSWTKLQGADLSSAKLQGADLSSAQLQGADLSTAKLQGANLSAAELQGADLSSADLQGADLSSARLKGAILVRAFTFRADAREADVKDALLPQIHFAAIRFGGDDGLVEFRDNDVAAWQAAALAHVHNDKRLERIKETFKRLVNPDKPTAEDEAIAADWLAKQERFTNSDATGAHHRAARASILGDLVCRDPAEYAAPHVARNLIRTDSEEHAVVSSLGDHLETFVARLKAGRDDPKQCPGVVGLTQQDWLALDAIEPDERATLKPPELTPP